MGGLVSTHASGGAAGEDHRDRLGHGQSSLEDEELDDEEEVDESEVELVLEELFESVT